MSDLLVTWDQFVSDLQIHSIEWTFVTNELYGKHFPELQLTQVIWIIYVSM